MLSHKHIWTAIDALAARHGHSPSGLARAAGLDPTTFNKSKRLGPQGRLRWPSTESLSKILGVTGASIEDFVALLSETSGGRSSSRMLPFLTQKDLAKKKAFDAQQRPIAKAWDRIAFPDLTDGAAFAVEVTGDAAAPLFRNGDVIVLSPQADVRRDDCALVKTKQGCVLLRFQRRTAKRVEFKTLNGVAEPKVFARDEVEWMARVVWARR